MIFEIVVGILITLLILALFPLLGAIVGGLISLIFFIGGIALVYTYFDNVLPFIVGFVILISLAVIVAIKQDIEERLFDSGSLFKYVMLKITPAFSDQQKIDKVKELAELEKLSIKNKNTSLNYAYQYSLTSFNKITNSVENELSTFLKQGNFNIVKAEPERALFVLDPWDNKLKAIYTGSFSIKAEHATILRIKIATTPVDMNNSEINFSLDCLYNSSCSHESTKIKSIVKQTRKCLIKYMKTHPEILSSD
jgi:divalent metal cation (Fe/Co/Zn/Cd) transporter